MPLYVLRQFPFDSRQTTSKERSFFLSAVPSWSIWQICEICFQTPAFVHNSVTDWKSTKRIPHFVSSYVQWSGRGVHRNVSVGKCNLIVFSRSVIAAMSELKLIANDNIFFDVLVVVAVDLAIRRNGFFAILCVNDISMFVVTFVSIQIFHLQTCGSYRRRRTRSRINTAPHTHTGTLSNPTSFRW